MQGAKSQKYLVYFTAGAAAPLRYAAFLDYADKAFCLYGRSGKRRNPPCEF